MRTDLKLTWISLDSGFFVQEGRHTLQTSPKKEFRNEEAILDIKDRPPFLHWLVLSVQHLFTMFGATVLVPLLIGINPSIALFSSGVGTLSLIHI